MKILKDNKSLTQAEFELLQSMLVEIKNEQENLTRMIEKNNKILMKRINKLQEYNEISDMRIQYLYHELKLIKDKIETI